MVFFANLGVNISELETCQCPKSVSGWALTTPILALLFHLHHYCSRLNQDK
ncbi:MAG: hypothetical protein R6V25_14710 [Desulfatiglandales bacterium]